MLLYIIRNDFGDEDNTATTVDDDDDRLRIGVSTVNLFDTIFYFLQLTHY